MGKRTGPRGNTFAVALAVLLLVVVWIGGHAPWLAAEAPVHLAQPTAQSVTPPMATQPIAEHAHRTPTVPIDPHSAWASAEACAATIGSLTAQPRGDALRIASWNLHWFPDGRAGQPSAAGGTDVAWMACAMASLRADVIAIQEVTSGPRGRTALLQLIDQLDQLTDGQWREYLDECNGGSRQHLGFLYDSARVTFTELHDVAELNPNRGACAGGLRPGASGQLRFRNIALQLITVHLDSGNTTRDYNNRLTSIRRLVATFGSRTTDTPVLALGDFNTMGCSECTLPADVEEEVTQLDSLLRPAGYHAVESHSELHPCSEHYAGKPQLLDRAVTTLPTARVNFEMAGLCAALACQRPRTTSPALSRLSDHCPIVVEVLAK
jgi:endonuclease/exonuclease/phosphatase family metal-dependent hydrolase